jgi:hypothetical protein
MCISLSLSLPASLPLSLSQSHKTLPVIIAKVLLEITRRALLAGVILVVPAVVRVVQLLRLTFGLVLGLLAVNVIGTLGLSETVDFAAGETRDELLGVLVRDGLACEREMWGVSRVFLISPGWGGG